MTKTQLRKRWRDATFVASVPVPRDRPPTAAEVSNIDMRGVPRLGNGEPYWYFEIRDANSVALDLSFGDGALGIRSSSVTDLACEEFKFDRATYFHKSSFDRSDFRSARLRLDARDCVFTDCTFDLSTFAGGFSEYGFTRCTFRNCSFRSARWKGTYFKACIFEACDMTRFQVIDSVVTAIKHRDCIDFSQDIFSGGDVRALIELPEVISE